MKNRQMDVQNFPYMFKTSRKYKDLKITCLLLLTVVLFQGCVAVNTFPQIARPGDTVSVMIGSSELASKNTVSVELTDSSGSPPFDLQALGLVRSVFNLRPEGRAYGVHYSEFIAQNNSWKRGHEPVQTVLVIDVPNTAAIGPATLVVNPNVGANSGDDSSGVSHPYTIALTIVDVIGQPGVIDNFITKTWNNPAKLVDFGDLEPAPHAKISFGRGNPGAFDATPGAELAAAEIVIDFDEYIVSGDDLNVYVPESTVRGNLSGTGPFGDNQRMVTWKHDGSQIHVYVIAPKGIGDKYLQVYVVHPKGLSGDPSLSLVSTTGYDLNGEIIPTTPQFNYYP